MLKQQQTLLVSVLGDSISTYEGYNPVGYPVYYAGACNVENGLAGVEDTWWMQVISGLKGALCVNNSFSGSLVSGDNFSSACSMERCRGLHGGDDPDLVLIYMGTNDRNLAVPLGTSAPQDTGKFYGAYRTMLKRIKEKYPAAKVACGTLLDGRLKDIVDPFYELFAGGGDERYNDAIRAAVCEEECLLVDLAETGARYESLDRIHPTKVGHELMARLWLDGLNAVLK